MDETQPEHVHCRLALYFPNLANQSMIFPCEWKPDEWQLLVLTWRGPRWEVFLDGVRKFDAALPRTVRQEELHPKFMVGAASIAVDELAIYRHPLGEEEMKPMIRACRR